MTNLYLNVIYADDTSVLITCTDIHEIIDAASITLRKLYAWSLLNDFEINCSKNKKAVVFRSKSTLCEPSRNLHLHNRVIQISLVAKTEIFFPQAHALR